MKVMIDLFCMDSLIRLCCSTVSYAENSRVLTSNISLDLEVDLGIFYF